jgi:hypothetical protein
MTFFVFTGVGRRVDLEIAANIRSHAYGDSGRGLKEYPISNNECRMSQCGFGAFAGMTRKSRNDEGKLGNSG